MTWTTEPDLLVQALLGSSEADVATVGASERWIMSRVIIVNRAAAPRRVSLKFVPNGASTGDSHFIFDAVVPAATDDPTTLTVELGAIGTASGKVRGYAGEANVVTVSIHGARATQV